MALNKLRIAFEVFNASDTIKRVTKTILPWPWIVRHPGHLLPYYNYSCRVVSCHNLSGDQIDRENIDKIDGKSFQQKRPIINLLGFCWVFQKKKRLRKLKTIDKSRLFRSLIIVYHIFILFSTNNLRTNNLNQTYHVKYIHYPW